MPFPQEYQDYEYFQPTYEEPSGGGGGEPSWGYMQGAEPYKGAYEPGIENWKSWYATPQSLSVTPSKPSFSGGGGGGFAGGGGMPSKPASKYPTLGDKPFFIPNKASTYGTETGEGAYNYPYRQTGYPTAPGTGEFSFPELKLPTLDESRISEIEQKAAAPGLRRLRQSVREVQGKYYENPNVKRMTLRDALAGYGAGIENVMTGARREAQAEYQQEFQPQVRKAEMEWQAKVQGMMAQYQNTWRDYMSRLNASQMGG